MSATADTHFDKASSLYKNDQVDEAIYELEQAIAIDPGHFKSLFVLAGLYESRKRFGQALTVYRSALKIDMDNAVTNLRLGTLLSSLGRNSEALTPLRMAWSNDRTAQTANALARALDETGHNASAQQMYEEAIRLNPDLADARFNLATLRFNDRKYESAIALYTTYMLKAGDSARAHRNIGKCFVQMGQIDAAVRSFDKAAAADPQDAATYLNLGLAYALKDNFDAAIVNYNRALMIDPAYTEARYNLGKSLRFKGILPEAISEFQTVLKESPNHYRSMNGLASCYLMQHDNLRAIELLHQVIEFEPDNELAHYNLGVALQNMNELEEASRHFQEVLRLNPTDEQAVAAVEGIAKRSLGSKPTLRMPHTPTLRLLAA